MIVLLTGPTGSGKTDTCWGLVSELENIVFLDCDWFASRSPFSWKNPADVESVYRILQSQIHFHLGEGRKHFVVTLTLEMAASLHQHRYYFEDFNLPICAFRLFCRPDVIIKRIVLRDRLQKDEEAANAIQGLYEFDRLFPDETTFTAIDTSDLTSDDVAKLIAQRLPTS